MKDWVIVSSKSKNNILEIPIICLSLEEAERFIKEKKILDPIIEKYNKYKERHGWEK